MAFRNFVGDGTQYWVFALNADAEVIHFITVILVAVIIFKN
jgi:hypothetical protein